MTTQPTPQGRTAGRVVAVAYSGSEQPWGRTGLARKHKDTMEGPARLARMQQVAVVAVPALLVVVRVLQTMEGMEEKE